MNFTYAEELKKTFTVTAHFYKIRSGQEAFNLRNRLEIIRTGVAAVKADALVIMMNPGSSRPLMKDFVIPLFEPEQISQPEWLQNQILIPTQPDNAQYQIMRLMNLRGWNFVRVLNLSDIRAGNSKALGQIHGNITGLLPDFPHSMFMPQRKHELKELLTGASQAPVILAWGTSILGYLEDIVLSVLPAERKLFLADESGNQVYRYPSPYIKEMKIAWLEKINMAIDAYYLRN
ncbi:MAG: hypothetical protein HY965_01755 [Ignavibacteriales bacterium]|nr:hypothetical protein [Ignavibacteriales bacterium]